MISILVKAAYLMFSDIGGRDTFYLSEYRTYSLIRFYGIMKKMGAL